MKLFRRTFRLSESTKRNLFMTPGFALILGTILAEACPSPRSTSQRVATYEAKSQTVTSMECEATLQIE